MPVNANMGAIQRRGLRSVSSRTPRSFSVKPTRTILSCEELVRLHAGLQTQMKTLYEITHTSSEILVSEAAKQFSWLNDDLIAKHKAIRDEISNLDNTVTEGRAYTQKQFNTAQKLLTEFERGVRSSLNEQGTNLQTVYNELLVTKGVSSDLADQVAIIRAQNDYLTLRDQEHRMALLRADNAFASMEFMIYGLQASSLFIERGSNTSFEHGE